jgi:hypothetical protein
MNNTCETCRFNQANTCRRFPPVQVREERMGHYDRYVVDVWQQPYISYTDWCGEWEARDGAKVEAPCNPNLDAAEREAIKSPKITAAKGVDIVDTPPSEGWIPWAGGECPVAGEAVGDIMCRNKGTVEIAALHWCLWQHHGHGADIIAYRVVKPADFRLEAGKYYITATGERVGPIRRLPSEIIAFDIADNDMRCWYCDGVEVDGDAPDIVALAADQESKP